MHGEHKATPVRDEGRKCVLLIAAATLAARKLERASPPILVGKENASEAVAQGRYDKSPAIHLSARWRTPATIARTPRAV